MQTKPVERPNDLTASWLTAVLGAGEVAGFDVERIGTGQMSECYRVRLRYADGATGLESVVLKVAASDPVSRQTGLALGLYEREVRFYGDVAPRLGGPIARCYHAAVDTSTGMFDLLLGDAGPAVVGDEIAGATIEQALLAVVELGTLQGPLLGDAALAEAPWLNREAPLNQSMIAGLYAGFLDRYGDRIAPAHRKVCERLVGAFDAYQAAEAERGGVRGLVHGDYRMDNLLFGAQGAERPLTVVDWQTVSWGPALTDLAYFLGCALPAADRRAHYDALLRAYHGALGPNAPLALGEVAEGVRRQSFFGVMMAIVSSMLVERTERGDRMFMTLLQRHCEHVLDTDALTTLPDPIAPEPLRPCTDDEAAHAPTDEPLWSESWYADFVDAAQGFGGWFRIGLVANQRVAWVQVLVCGPELSTVAVLDYQVPSPADPWVIRTDTFDIGHRATEPLRTYRLDVRAQGQAYSDPSALLRGESGTPVGLTMNLLWTTDGMPYQYRVTTRYEIPCTVTGTVTVGDKSYRLDAVPGQRDHSWGVRDWWSMDWMWSALHLEDGTHLHALDIDIPNVGPVGIGYVQDSGQLTELHTVRNPRAFGANGLPLNMSLSLEPGEVAGDIDIRGHAPVVLTGPDGQISEFARAWVRIDTKDGRTGVGWMEWNRNRTPRAAAWRGAPRV